MNIKVLGGGCSKCEGLLENVQIDRFSGQQGHISRPAPAIACGQAVPY